MSEESTPETPGIEVLPIKMGMHLGEHDEPTESIELDLGSEPCIIVRPCEQDGVDLVLDIILSRTSPTMAVAMLTAAHALLIEEIRQNNGVEKLLKDIFADANKSEESTENTGEL